ncbi:helicase domain protein [Desulfitobacterium hafniense DCB-2]|uniref:Super II DNA/RNA helicase, SNF2 protein n=2 Tax=Desulfitobacterium hafniense TaxID=49338 RepID=A0A098AX25_DESHA|nr:helicase domain protein [Desulfitobacterium hafniense DCB-2]CDX00672.1 Super II DNA/RNA helicase, SNF2 protein [Desulfitobacterium hafniense]
MARLEDITVGSSVIGIAGNQSVSVVAVKWYGNAVLEITFKDVKGQLASQLLYREDEERLNIAHNGLLWSFDADANLLRLTSEAYRINLAHIFDPYLAVHTSAIEPLPHQISAVYQEMLSRLPLRYILADDPGAGKTIMTGLFLKELLMRGDLKRCMIVSPGNLAEQWQDELYRKFSLRFEILSNDRIESAVTGNVFTEANLCIVRLDKLSRNEEIQEKLRVTDWDLIVVDEAHKMSATVWGGEIKYTKRFQLGRLLSSITRHFLLLTATPHNGKEEDFQLFMSLIDQDRFEGVARSGNQAVDVSDVMRRLVKEELLKFDGLPLFPERIAYTVNYDLSLLEAKLYGAVTEYVQEEFNRADQLNNERKTTVGFALTILQRRLASSPEAIYQSLKRRRERLESRLAEERLGKRASEYSVPTYDDYDDDDLPSAELEDTEEKVVDQATAAQTIQELEAEIATLKKLERMANDVRQSGEDRKWDELSRLLQDNDTMFGTDGLREKLIIFTEHRDTLRYLTDKIRSLLGNEEAVVTIHGGLLRDERRKVEELFKQDKEVRILIATDAAGEGINLQRAHLMVNYDLPWNPNRLEQRFGRIHRIGQTEVCHLWNLVSKETREGMVFQRLFEKLEQEREALKGKVFDVLGKVSFDNKSLKDLILEAVRYGNDPAVRARLYEVVDHSLDHAELERLLDEHALTEDTMDVRQVMAIREDMERMEAHKLQPHFIESFFIEAFTSVGGKIRPREKGRYEITSVPFAVRNRDMQIGCGEPVLQRYERVCFDKPYTNIQGQVPAALIAPGHPLLEATIDLVRERNMDVLKRGAVFIDDTDFGTEARLLFYVEDSVQDGVILPSGGKRIISKHIHFVEIREDGMASNAGYAPYLDYRAAKDDEQAAIRSFLSTQQWLQSNVEDIAVGYAISEIIPAHVSEVRERKIKLIDKTAKAVKERLTAEIQYWDFRSADLKMKEQAGKVNAKQNSQVAARRAEELEARMQKRLAELEAEKLISAMPPVVVGGALVIPRGLLNKLTGKPDTFTADALARRTIELAAMKAVMYIETSLGFIPRDVSASKCGYDVESQIPQDKRGADGHTLRFIEVKGRASGADTVTVSKNEILTAFNKPDEYILAIVEVDGANTKTVYLKKPFHERPDFAATSVNYSIAKLVNGAEITLQRG